MKKRTIEAKILSLSLLALLIAPSLFAQGYGDTLRFQGVGQATLQSAGSRAMGGVAVAVQRDIGLMFQNPATLPSITGIQLSLGGFQISQKATQEQHYAPVRYYPNLSLLLEGRTAHIPNPDPSLPGFTAQDTVQRPFDDIQPNWSRSSDRSANLQALLAVPVTAGKVKVVAGAGIVEYADLDHYYQNNNVLSPSILSQRPLPTLRPTDDNPLVTEWSRVVQSRSGSIQGYGVALAGRLEKLSLSLGFSGMLLDGSSDDFEQEVGRGRLTFFSNAFRADSVYSRITRIGTSDFSGREFTFSGMLSGRYASIGFAIKPPSTITRTYTTLVETDTTGAPSTATLQGEDKLKLPWRGTAGLALAPRENLTIGIEYEFRPYASARYVDDSGDEAAPWLSSSLFRLGAEYRLLQWLALRGGMRGNATVFEPEGNHIAGEPVTYTVYSAGLGVFIDGLQVHLTYENSLLKYQDIWASAISKNSDRRHTLVAQLSYALPWGGR